VMNTAWVAPRIVQQAAGTSREVIQSGISTLSEAT
jgi:hypothetical protein